LLPVGALLIISTEALFVATLPNCWGQVGARVEVPRGGNSLSALRTRVKEFYGFLRVGNWSRAEAYVTPESLDTFRNENKTPFLSFQINSIHMRPDGRSARVEATLKVQTPYSGEPFPFPRKTSWRLVGGLWSVEVPKPPLHPLRSMFTQPPPSSASSLVRQPAELKFESVESIVDLIQLGEIRTVRFAFTNVSDHAVRLGKVITGCDCMRLKDGKKEYKPGESGTLEFEWDPVHRDFAYALEDTISVHTEPGGAVTFLMARTEVGPRVSNGGKSER
jgi:uncharacterized protein DUF1573